MNSELRRALEQVAGRARRVRLWGSLALCWLAWSALGFALARQADLASSRPVLFLPAWIASLAVSALACTALALRSARDPRRVANWIEARHPELGTGLLVAIEEDAKAAPGRVVGYIPASVIRQALEHRAANDWAGIVPSWKLGLARLAHAVGLVLVAAATFMLIGQEVSKASGPAAIAAGAGAIKDGEVVVEPGNAEVERGTPLLVVARFGGQVPGEASLVVEDGKTKAESRRAMGRSLEDPTFAGRVESVDAELGYRVDYAGRSTATYRVTVFEFPELRRTDARLAYPAYTGLETRIAEDIRHVTAVEGTALTLTLRINKDVVEAKLVDEKGQATPLTRVPGDEPTYTAGWTLADSHRYKVILVDAAGRAAKGPPEIAVNVTRNRPATVAMTRPSRDVRVSPVEELKLQAKVEDDFGVVRHGLTYSAAGLEPKEIALAGPGGSPRKILADHLLDLEGLKVAPDQLVTYFFWAEDIGPDGQPRRSSGDMFFAEVRHFEEIFRQGEAQSAGESEQQQQQQQGAQQQAAKLAELQKQIINGTWTVIRRESGPRPSDKFAPDLKALGESQAEAIEQAGAMAGTLRDPASKESLRAAVKAMEEAVRKLKTAEGAGQGSALASPLASEQAAYQALLKLRAREFEVTRRNRSRSQGGAQNSASQQQLDQLELDEDENRYEQQRTARAQAEQATQKQQEQRETRQVLNRLAELARRQADLNERIKELKAALVAAKDAKAKEELDRQLKRLRDQQEQLLRDTDEVRERMEREENRDRMAESREQVDQARENVRQASESLEKGQLSQAVNQAARASEELDRTREDLRKKSSERFADEMTEMRDQARKLEGDQARLTEKLDAAEKATQRSLRDDGGKQELKQGLEQQGKQLGTLLERMRQTVGEAEETEPLLAKELFEAAKKADGQAIPRSLKEAEQLADLGIADEAAKSSRRAAQGLEQLREGVEKAASSVLGDEVAALKRAQGELEDLANQVEKELPRTAAPGRPQPGQPRPGQAPADRELARGETPGDPARPGQPQARSPGPVQPGEQPGDRQSQQSRQQAQQGNPPGRGQQGQRQPGAAQGNQPGQEPREGQGAQPGQEGQGQRGQQPGQGQEPGRGQGEPPGQGEGQGQQPGEAQGKGQQPSQGQEQGQQPGQGQGQGQQPGQAQQGRGQGQRPGQGQGQQPGQGDQPGQQPGEGQGQAQGGQQPGQGQGQGQGGQQPGQGQRPGQGQQPGGRGQGQGQRQAGGPGGGGGGGGGMDRVLEGLSADAGGPGGPITGEGFRQWSDRMREVEEILPDTGMRAEAARIRDRVRGAREEFKRHSKEPDPARLREMVAEPIRELRDRVAQEVRRRESPDALVPIDRDPVPPQFTEGVKRYYERLGSGR